MECCMCMIFTSLNSEGVHGSKRLRTITMERGARLPPEFLSNLFPQLLKLVLIPSHNPRWAFVSINVTSGCSWSEKKEGRDIGRTRVSRSQRQSSKARWLQGQPDKQVRMPPRWADLLVMPQWCSIPEVCGALPQGLCWLFYLTRICCPRSLIGTFSSLRSQMELTALETSFLVTDFHSPYHFPRVVISKDNELFKYCLTCFFFSHTAWTPPI